MKKFQNGFFSIVDIIAYSAQLNIQWVIFTLLGGVIFGIGPATATLIQFLNDYREERIDRSFMDFWRQYKADFRRTSLLGAGFLMLVSLLVINLRITSVFFKQAAWYSPLYALLSLVILYICLMSFFTYVKAEDTSFPESLKASIVLTFRYPLQGICMILACYSVFLILGAKSSLMILFGGVAIFFLAEFFHSQMIKKLKNLQSKWS